MLLRNLHEVAFGQSGWFTAAQAREVGYSYQAQKHHVDAGSWVRVNQGMFRLPGWPATEDDAYVRWGLWRDGRAAVSHATALRVHDLSDADPVRVHLTVPPRFRGHADAAVLHRAELQPGDVEERDGWRVTTPLRTLVDYADTGTARGAGQEVLETAVSEALKRGLTTPRLLREAGDERGNRAALHLERVLSVVLGRG